MTFTDPGWLIAAPGLCAALLMLWWRYDARNRRALERFVAARWRVSLTGSVSAWRRRLQRGLLLGAIAALCVSLAGPQWGYRWELLTSRGNDIVFALDTSRSMLTPDVKPDRLVRAKLAIDDLTGHLAGDAVGIVAFAGSAFLVNPLTLDDSAFHESLAAIDTETIPRGGTDIATAIRESDLALRRRSGGARILILLTDGENLEGDAVAAAREAAADGVRIYTVGVGTAAGAPIPLPAALGGGFVKDDTGAVVTSRLDEPTLKAIAAAGGGFYVPLGAQAEGLEAIARTVIDPLSKHNIASRAQRIGIERYQWPLAAATAMLLSSLLIGTRRRAGVTRRGAAVRPVAVRVAGRGAAALAVGALAMAAQPLLRAAPAPASPEVPAAAAPPSASAPPAKPPDAALDAAAAAYRAGRFSQAAQAFRQSITAAPSDSARRLAAQEDAYYDLGNTLYRTGQKTETSSPDDTLKQWKAAVTAYDTALQLRPDDADSKFNRDFVQRKIDALTQQQNQQNHQNQKNQQDPQKNQQKNSPNDPGRGQAPPPGAGSPPPGAPSGARPPAAGTTPGEPPAPAPMSPEEARELLDSAKGDERRSLGAPVANPPTRQAPDKPYKNW